MRKILFLAISILIYVNSFSATINAIKSGDWNDPATWDLGRIPQEGDDVNINNNYTVTVSQSVTYTVLSVTIGWSGSLLIQQDVTLSISSYSSSNGGGNPVEIYGRLNIYGNATQSNGTVNIEEGGYMYVTGDYSGSGGSAVTLNVNGTLETNTLTTSSITINIGPNGKIIVHSDFTNASGATVTIYGGEFIIEGNYVNQGDATITINDDGLLHIYGDYTNTGGSDIVVNDGTVIIDGNVDNRGGSTFTIADGSYVEVNGDLSNTGGGTITVDGSLYVEGDLTNRGGSTIDGTGSLYVGGTIDDPEDKIEPGLLVSQILHTIASGQWSDPAIWSKTSDDAPCNCTPPINSDVTISTNTQVTLNETAKIANLTIEDNAQLSLLASANLTIFDNFTINGTLIMQNDLTSSPNLLDQGTVSYGTNAQIITKLTIGAGKYSYIGNYIPNVPTSSITQIGTNTNPNVYQYDETQADNWGDSDPSNDYLGWINPSAEMTPATGFAIYSDQTYTFTLTGSSFTTGTVTTQVTLTSHSDFTNSAEVDGWNLLANPYPSSIDAATFLNDNSSVLNGNVYLWDDDGSNGADYSSADYIQFNSTGTIVNSANGGDFNGYIAPNQAFFVQAIQSGTVTFQNSQKVDNQSHLLKKGDRYNPKMIRIKLALYNDTLYNETLIGFSALTSDGFDQGYDGYKRQGNANIAFYSLMDGKPMGIQALSDCFDYKQIPLGYKLKQPGRLKIALKTYNTDERFKILLYDQYTGNTHDLILSPYKFTTNSGTFNNRFILIVEKHQISTGIHSSVQNAELTVNYYDKSIHIDNPTSINFGNTQITIRDIQGRIVKSSHAYLAPGSSVIISTGLKTSGVYIIILRTERHIQTTKIVVIE